MRRHPITTAPHDNAETDDGAGLSRPDSKGGKLHRVVEREERERAAMRAFLARKGRRS